MKIAGYVRISVDVEQNRDNISIENQKAIIKHFVDLEFTDAKLTFFEDRDKSGYTFEQRESYQQMRKELVAHRQDIMIIKDFSRFARRNGKGLVELEDLRDAGVRIISIDDNIDFPESDDWTKIQIQFLVNEMPVRDASRKVTSVIKQRQMTGQWICSAPYGYDIDSNHKFVIVEDEALIVRTIFKQYIQGFGYSRIAHSLTDSSIPTPQASRQARRSRQGKLCGGTCSNLWSAGSIAEILNNDFYTGILRQHKTARKTINGKDGRIEEGRQFVFANNHTALIDKETYDSAQCIRAKRSTTNYRGAKKYETPYTGLMFCGDCGSPMFSLSRPGIQPTYLCGKYYKHGKKFCSRHATRTFDMDNAVKRYLRTLNDKCGCVFKAVDDRFGALKKKDSAPDLVEELRQKLARKDNEIINLIQQQNRETAETPEAEAVITRRYKAVRDRLESELEGLNNSLKLAAQEQQEAGRPSDRTACASELLNTLLEKERLTAKELSHLVERINVTADCWDITLKSNIDKQIDLLQTAVGKAGADSDSNITA